MNATIIVMMAYGVSCCWTILSTGSTNPSFSFAFTTSLELISSITQVIICEDRLLTIPCAKAEGSFGWGLGVWNMWASDGTLGDSDMIRSDKRRDHFVVKVTALCSEIFDCEYKISRLS